MRLNNIASMSRAGLFRAGPATPSGAAAPVVLYTDLISGPLTGGENNRGCYLSIFGLNFGSSGLGSTVRVYINNVEVAEYIVLDDAKVSSRLAIKRIAVRPGALGGASNGVNYAIKVTVGGVDSNTDLNFMPNPGTIRYVSLSGNDGTAVGGDIALPYRNLQTPARGGAYGALVAGDQIIVRGGTWSDIGFDGAWLRFRDRDGSAPTGSAGTGYIAICAMPGETVLYEAPTTGAIRGGIQGASGSFPDIADYVVVSGFVINQKGHAAQLNDAAPINLQAGSDFWRVVNNDCTWPDANLPNGGDTRAGGISGNGKNVKILGNYIHDIEGATLNHGMYYDTGCDDLEVAYNVVYNCLGGNMCQFFDNLGIDEMTGVLFHHNWFELGNRYGLNLADGLVSGKFWNNVVIGTDFSGIRINTGGFTGHDIEIVHNTVYDCARVSTAVNAHVQNSWNTGPANSLKFQHNIIMAGPNTNGSAAYYADDGDDSGVTMAKNLWFGEGAVPAKDSTGITGDPLFTNAAARDFSVGSSSPALNAATATMDFSVTNDFLFLTRPQGAASDIGAFERAA